MLVNIRITWTQSSNKSFRTFERNEQYTLEMIWNSRHMKEVSGDILEYPCIVCVGNCISQKTNPQKEPMIHRIYTQFPEADCYRKRENGRKDKPGTISVNKSSNNTIITIFGQYYEGSGTFQNDNKDMRLKWFSSGLSAIANLGLAQYPKLAFYSNIDGGGKWSDYQQQIQDMLDTIGLKTERIPEVTIVHPSSSDAPSGEVKKDGLLSLDAVEIIPVDDLHYFELISQFKRNPDWIYHLYDLPIDPSWSELFSDLTVSAELRHVDEQLQQDLKRVGDTKEFYPRPDQIFRAFNLCTMQDAKVVILGQDCYPGNDRGVPHACGLSFSVNDGIKVPPSLKNIYKALENDQTLNFKAPEHGNLEKWAKQGVILLNVALTIRAGERGSHLSIWETFSGLIIERISKLRPDIIFVLWGGEAQKREKMIKSPNVLKYVHPSPMNGTAFYQCPNFREINDILAKQGKTPIDWNLTE